ncbi:hypothetical protein CBR_g53715 [Chara braunii]|uniref:Protein-tyrosine-phosphatase n=1 Tax=Chara braunii TaxID=69332 RepID=A0A388MB76_CHABU|nr:hypothetical protein CBR_g53715 [Chara braunii]|eukprot:GBG91824.1 hypothetical protein CBR_g53715 [Chara braunii]
MTTGSQEEVEHKHIRRSLTNMKMLATLLSPRVTPAPPMDMETTLGGFQKGVPKVGTGVAGLGVPSSPATGSNPRPLVSAANLPPVNDSEARSADREAADGGGAAMFPNVRRLFWRSTAWIGGRGKADGKGANDVSATGESFGGRASEKAGRISGKAVFFSPNGAVGDNGRTTNTNSNSNSNSNSIALPSARVPLRSPLISRSPSVSRLEVASPRARMGVEANKDNVGRGEVGSGGSGYQPTTSTPLSPGALRREANGLARGAGVAGAGARARACVQLDLTALARNCEGGCAEPSELHMRRDKFAFFEKQCSRVREHIYLGSDLVARNRETLRAAGITHVLNCVGFLCPEYFAGQLVYRTLWLQDTPGEDILSVLYDVFDYFEQVKEEGGRVFVHCSQGVSRSTALVIAYLMWKEGKSYDDAFRDVKAARGVTNPNMGFACQLIQWQRRLLAGAAAAAAGGGGGGGARLYRIAPHSHNDPLHLVHKLVLKPGVESLDTRGAFLLLASSGLVVWRGRECPGVIALAAEKVARQVIKYEKMAGPIRFVKEGEEKAEFWATLRSASSTPSSLSASPRGGAAGNGSQRLTVPAYDADYDAIAKAALGNLGSERLVAATRGSERLVVTTWGNERLVAAGDSPREAEGRERDGSRGRGSSSSNPSAVNMAQDLLGFCHDDGCSAPSQSIGKNNAWLENRGERGGGRTADSGSLSETEGAVVAVVGTPRGGAMKGGRENGSPPCCMPLSPSGREGEMGREGGKHAETKEQNARRENGEQVLWRGGPEGGGGGGAQEAPTISQRRGCDQFDAAMADSAKTEGAGSAEVLQVVGTARERADEKPADGAAATGEAVSVRHVLMEEWIETARLNRGVRRDEGPTAMVIEEEKRPPGSSDHGTLPRLFEWPSREEVRVFDSDDLQSQKAFVLWIPKARAEQEQQREEREEREERSAIVVWVGRECSRSSGVDDGQETEEEDEQGRGGRAWQRRWWRVGDQFRLWRSLAEETHIQVVEEGKEPDDFWAYFIHG